MNENEATDGDILWESGEESEAPRLSRRRPPIPPQARCVQCGSAELTALPYFSAGAGTVFRPDADDVICRRCGTISPPELEGG